ncbi:hypothetical protein L345_17915 [Ophiophagus hannah]|uniref:Uncharacterized protein n=1 Tax=Ophiophagus hannah TaxID=8665 RepID=V8N277_OPHHA|nr:hypothetical protein L345_17915 [Ophiophagus hannah]
MDRPGAPPMPVTARGGVEDGPWTCTEGRGASSRQGSSAPPPCRGVQLLFQAAGG